MSDDAAEKTAALSQLENALRTELASEKATALELAANEKARALAEASAAREAALAAAAAAHAAAMESAAQTAAADKDDKRFVAVNPGRLAKGNIGGTLAHVYVSEGAPEPGASGVQAHSVHSRARVDIVRI